MQKKQKAKTYQFQVTMDNLFRVEIVNSTHELCKESACITLLEVAVGEDMIEQLAS